MRGDFRCIGATTVAEYRRFILNKDKVSIDAKSARISLPAPLVLANHEPLNRAAA